MQRVEDQKTADCVGGTGRWMNPGLGQRVSSTLQRDQCDMHFPEMLKVPPMQVKTPRKAVGASKTAWRYKKQAKRIPNHNGQAILSSMFRPRVSYQDDRLLIILRQGPSSASS